MTDYKITANSALSEYLAANYADGRFDDRLKRLPGERGSAVSIRCLDEAVYQNPLILESRAQASLMAERRLCVQYDTDPAAMEEKRKKLQKR